MTLEKNVRKTLYRCSVQSKKKELMYNKIMNKNKFVKINGLSNYQVWLNGNVISENTGSIMGSLQPNGYVRMTLTNDEGKPQTFYGHQLVWLAFKGEIPKGMQLNHIDEDKTNNAIWNLELVTPK